ncbi:hypothetical protein LCGC14_0494650 [marine sediment metagenome]|uniref:HD-GYP domain-containing protein n=1 Tax=marine sediment metagenome TaxID=412755 RepID=A0A0F9SAP7_9ZZZZ
MIVQAKIPLHRMILSLSEALDYVHPRTADHQRRVAYIAFNLAREMDVSKQDLLDIFMAASLHDIGLIRGDNRLLATDIEQLEALEWHCQTGYEVLRDSPILARAAEIVRHHHTEWQWPDKRNDSDIPHGAHIVALADFVERAINRATPILGQSKHIIDQVVGQSGSRFCPECAEVFQTIAQPAAFWLDCVSQRVYGVLLKDVEGPDLPATDVSIQQIAEIFGRVVDAMSRWTATHTCGVAASAVALCRALNFAPRGQAYMHTAGWLHDLGKLAIPASILDFEGKYTDREWAVMKTHTYHTFRTLETAGIPQDIVEWAAFHHERLDGKGYPFSHRAEDLTLGARIMGVADMFGAIAEDRPYREAMSKTQVLKTLARSVSSGALDGDIVTVFRRNYDDIDGARRQEVARYSQGQQRLASIAA